MSFYRSEARVIHNFRGLSEWFDRGREDRARPVGDLIDGLLKQYRIEPDSPVKVILDRWRDLLGPKLSDGCAPERLTEEGTLFIVTRHPQIRQVLRFEERNLLRRLNHIPGCESVRRLVIR